MVTCIVIFYSYFSLWLNEIINQTEIQSKIKKDRCEICNFKEKLELHHIAGRKHDHRMINSCKSCHRWLTDRQKIWDVRWWFISYDDNLKRAFFYMGIYDILSLKSKKTGNTIYESIANSYIEIISKYLKEAG